MSLSKVSFYGKLNTSDYNGRRTIEKPSTLDADDSDDPTPDSEDCFRYQIEHYITHQGSFPFVACPSGYGGIPWAFKGDESWYINGCWPKEYI
jgi:hypothetical protein